jgi:hypothetical protein
MGKKKGNNECGEEKVKKVKDLIRGMGRREREERRKQARKLDGRELSLEASRLQRVPDRSAWGVA